MASDAPGQRALAHIDHVLAEMPRKNDNELSHATVCLAEFRDGITAAWRRSGIDAAQRKQLDHLNAVITVVLGTHFPLGDVPWQELRKARGWLADIVGTHGPAA